MENRASNPEPAALYEEIINFFRPLAALKADFTKRLEATVAPPAIDGAVSSARLRDGLPVLDKTGLTVDYALLKSFFMDLLGLVAGRAPEEAAEIRELVDRNGMFETLVRKVLRDEEITGEQAQMLRFLLQETVIPLLAVHAERLAKSLELKDWARGYCPVCGGKPLVAVLRGEEGKKFLICGACHTQWPFSRIACHNCGEKYPQGASYFTVSENDRYRIEVCDACKSYLKIIDQRRGHSDISLDLENLTTLHLDIIAREKGYMNVNLFMID